MYKDKYKGININNVISEIGNGWTTIDDLNIHKATVSASISNINKGLKRSPEMKAQMSISRKGKKPTQETIDKVTATKRANGGFNVSEEQKNKISAAKKGKRFSEEHKEKLRLAHKDKKQTAETITKRINTQAANRGPFIYKGISYLNCAEASRILDINDDTLSLRVKRSQEKTAQVNTNSEITVNGIVYIHLEMAAFCLGISQAAVLKLINTNK